MEKRTELKAIVTDGLWRKSLSAIRSLGKAGFEVTVMGGSLATTGFWSRYTKDKIIAPLASQDPEAFGLKLSQALEAAPSSVVLPMEDASLMWVSKNRERLAGRFLLAPHSSLETAQDKGATLKHARTQGLTCPKTWEPANPREFADLAVSLTPGHFVAKPRTGTGSTGLNYGETKSYEEWLTHWRRYGAMLVQERLPPEGKSIGVSMLMDSYGECAAAFAHERLQQFPTSGGPSTDRQGVRAPELIVFSTLLLKSLNWRGVAMVEWKIDSRDGTPKLMEINPRFWGSLELAVRSGIDFPTLYARAAIGEKLPPAHPYLSGLRCRWLMPGDILRYVTSSERESLREFLQGLPASAEEWDRSDVMGAAAAVVCTAAHALNPRYWKYARKRG